MPNFSTMTSSYPFQLIRGLGRVGMYGAAGGAVLGGAYGMSGRRGSMGRAAGYGALGAGVAVGGLAMARANNIAVARGLGRGGVALRGAGFGIADAMMGAATRMGNSRMGNYSPWVRGMAGRVERGASKLGQGIMNLRRFL